MLVNTCINNGKPVDLALPIKIDTVDHTRSWWALGGKGTSIGPATMNVATTTTTLVMTTMTTIVKTAM